MKLLDLDPSKSLFRSSRDLLVQLLQVQVPYNQIHLRAGHRIQHKHSQILRKGVLLTCVFFHFRLTPLFLTSSLADLN